jgi:hypothetical protein
MNTGNSGIGLYNPSTGQLKPGSYNHLNFWSYQTFHLNQAFAPWEVALTVVAAVVMVATVVLFARRLRAG